MTWGVHPFVLPGHPTRTEEEREAGDVEAGKEEGTEENALREVGERREPEEGDHGPDRPAREACLGEHARPITPIPPLPLLQAGRTLTLKNS